MWCCIGFIHLLKQNLNNNYINLESLIYFLYFYIRFLYFCTCHYLDVAPNTIAGLLLLLFKKRCSHSLQAFWCSFRRHAFFDVAFPLPFHILQVPPIDVSSLIMFSWLLWATGLRGRQGRYPHWGAEGLRGPGSADRGESWVATWGVQWWPLWARGLLKWKILRIWNKTAAGFICLQGERRQPSQEGGL